MLKYRSKFVFSFKSAKLKFVFERTCFLLNYNKAIKHRSLRSLDAVRAPFIATLWGLKVFCLCGLKVRKSKTRNFLSWFVLGFRLLKLYRLCGKALKSEVNVSGFFSYILVPSVEKFSHFKTTILLVL